MSVKPQDKWVDRTRRPPAHPDLILWLFSLYQNKNHSYQINIIEKKNLIIQYLLCWSALNTFKLQLEEPLGAQTNQFFL